jgi:hypothetical protein
MSNISLFNDAWASDGRKMFIIYIELLKAPLKRQSAARMTPTADDSP